MRDLSPRQHRRSNHTCILAPESQPDSENPLPCNRYLLCWADISKKPARQSEFIESGVKIYTYDSGSDPVDQLIWPTNRSLRSKRFRRLCRTFETFFPFCPRENWGEGQKNFFASPQFLRGQKAKNCSKVRKTC